MCRPSKPLLSCLFGVLLLGLPDTVRAQLSLPKHEFDAELSDKELAKALFESTQATTRDLAQARVEAARTQMRVCYEKYLAAAQDATFDVLMETVARIAEAELAALEKPTPADRQAALAARWLFALAADQMNEAKYKVGRVSLADFMLARRARLDAEIRLREAGAGKNLSDPFAPSLPFGLEEPSLDLFENDLEKPSFDFFENEATKSAFEAGQADLRDLARARRDAARIQFQERYGKYRAGAQDGTLALLRESVAFLIEAELSALEKPTAADRLAARSSHWLFAWAADKLVEAKYKVGRVSRADVMQARHARLDAEIELRRANGEQKLLAPFPPTTIDFDGEELILDLPIRELAKAQFEAGQADLRDLARRRQDAIHTCFQERYEKYRASAAFVTLDLLLETARQMLETELADHDDPVERLEAVQRYRELTREAENIVGAKYMVGRVSLADFAQAQVQRLDAEIRMREAREKVKAK